MKNEIVTKELMKEHYEILINNNKVKIYTYSDRYYLDPITGEKTINKLHLKTNIDEQYFNKWNEDNKTTFILIKSGKWIQEYNCEYEGGVICYRPFYEKCTYKVLSKNIYKEE